MKSLIAFFILTILIGCREKSSDIVGLMEKRQEKNNNLSTGALKITINNKTYTYDNIDWKKSRIKLDEDIRLSIRQESLPRVQFIFPEVEKTLAEGQEVFKIPDIHRRGHSPITLNFMVTIDGKTREGVTLRKGEMKVSLKDKHLIVKFNGEGGPTLNASVNYAISGLIDIKME